MTATGRQFSADLSAWAARVAGRVDELARQSVQETARQVVVATPFDTGFLATSWQPSIGAEPRTNPPSKGADYSAVAAGVTAGSVFWMVNNAAYARRLEFGFVGEDALGRYYNQPGRFYVRGVVARWAQIVDAQARDLRIL